MILPLLAVIALVLYILWTHLLSETPLVKPWHCVISVLVIVLVIIIYVYAPISIHIGS